MELYALDLPPLMPDSHDNAVGTVRHNLKSRRHQVYGKRMVPAASKRIRKTRVDPDAIMINLGRLPVNRTNRRMTDRATECDIDRLTAETDAKQRNLALADDLDA